MRREQEHPQTRGSNGHAAPRTDGNGNGGPPVMTAAAASAPSRHRKVIVGAQRGAQVLGETLVRERRAAHYSSLSFVDGETPNSRLLERLQQESPDEVFFVLGEELDEDVVARVGSRLLMDGVAVHFVLPPLAGPPVRAHATRIGTQSLISLYAVKDGRAAQGIRRVIDVLGAALLLVLLAPLIAAVAILVWCTMGRPVLYVQQRVGKSARLFGLYKFRSMILGSDDILRRSPELYQRYVASNFKLPEEEDPRITRLGRFLRKASLDELPQLWNVLRGEMSLVGPRPVVPEEVAEYGGYARLFLRVKPGLTGLWQVSGRSGIGYPERARMDLQYLGGRSLSGDLGILLRTLPAVIRMRGAL